LALRQAALVQARLVARTQNRPRVTMNSRRNRSIAAWADRSDGVSAQSIMRCLLLKVEHYVRYPA
jgi:hypothetical protein